MGRLCVAVAECKYREIDGQLKEQFIHGFNDNIMLDEVIRELTTKGNNKQTRVEAQWAQAAILNHITQSHKFNKIKMTQKAKSSQDRETTHQTFHRWPCRYCGGKSCTQTVPSIWKIVCWMWEDWPIQKGV